MPIFSSDTKIIDATFKEIASESQWTAVDDKGKMSKIDMYTTEDVAKILKVGVTTIKRWRTEKIFGCDILSEDMIDHNGVHYYFRDKIDQLATVFRKDWRTAWAKPNYKSENALTISAGQIIKVIPENLKLKKIQLKPIEKLKIPIDITTQNAMNITIPAGKEKTIDRIIYDIPEGITTDQIIKQGLKKESRFFKNLTLKPQNPDITADDIVNFGVNANLFKTTLDRVVFSPIDNHILTEYEYKWTVENNDLVPYLRLDDGSIGEKCIVELKEIPIVPKDQNGSVDISEIIKQGIQKGVPAFEELPIMAVDKSDEYILELAKKDGFFKCKVITEGTGIFSDAFKNVKFYESRAKNIMSYLRFLVQNADSETRIDEFDYGILSACFTEISNGNNYTTPNRIFHILGGGHILRPQMRQKILDSLTKLRKVTLQLFLNENAFKKNIIDADQQSKFNKDTNVSFQGYLLPNEVFTAEVNGKIVNDTIHLLNGGALRINSEARKQILTCDPELAHPPVRTTDGTIATTHFLLRRSLSIIGSNDQDRKHISRLRNIITLDDLYSHVSADTAREQQHAREIAIKILDFFVEKGLLKSYKIEKKDNGKIYSIVIQF